MCVWFGVVGAFGGGLPLAFTFVILKRVFRFNSYGGGRTEVPGTLLSESTNIAKPRPKKAQKRPRDDIGQENVCAGSGGSQYLICKGISCIIS